jgi:hypothetical protein
MNMHYCYQSLSGSYARRVSSVIVAHSCILAPPSINLPHPHPYHDTHPLPHHHPRHPYRPGSIKPHRHAYGYSGILKGTVSHGLIGDDQGRVGSLSRVFILRPTSFVIFSFSCHWRTVYHVPSPISSPLVTTITSSLVPRFTSHPTSAPSQTPKHQPTRPHPLRVES